MDLEKHPCIVGLQHRPEGKPGVMDFLQVPGTGNLHAAAGGHVCQYPTMAARSLVDLLGLVRWNRLWVGM